MVVHHAQNAGTKNNCYAEWTTGVDHLIMHLYFRSINNAVRAIRATFGEHQAGGEDWDQGVVLVKKDGKGKKDYATTEWYKKVEN